ncbi:MAG: hypothetical protein R6V08_03705 [Desulfuromonadales bacterium]
MASKVFLVHGWSVQETTTYQALHRQLAENGYALEDVFLGRYVSLEDKVEIRDIALALHMALDEKLGADWSQPFHIVTHSTGALVVRHWIARHYTGDCCRRQPLRNLVFLAGPHFGSRLAHHGRSMLAHARYLGDTGEQVLGALELGSRFSWELADAWIDSGAWREKGIRPYCLTGDRVKQGLADRFAAKIFPAGFETGSDMVVRVPAANLNFRRYTLDARNGDIQAAGGIEDVPFGALHEYLHSGAEHGIMNSIKRRSTPANHKALRLILECLGVANDAGYERVHDLLARQTAETRRKRPGFAQLDFRFRDSEGQPVDDYVFKFGWWDNGRQKPSETVAHSHKNTVAPSHFTVFIEMKHLDPEQVYFMEFDSRSGTELYSYEPDPFRVTTGENAVIISELVREDHTTQIDIVLSRQPSRKLFVFHRGDDPDLHVGWNRNGDIVEIQL